MKIQKLKMIFGSPGTGKTKKCYDEIVREAKQQNLQPNEILYVSFNRELKIKAEQRLCGMATVKTLHSLAFSSLNHVHDLPEGLTSDPDNFLPTTEVKQALKSLIPQATKMQNSDLSSALGTFKLIVIDEFNDFNSEFISFIRKVVEACADTTTKVIIAGDPNQRINSYLESKQNRHKNYFDEAEVMFEGVLPIETEYLQQNYRTANPALIGALNSYMNRALQADSKLQYDNEIRDIVNNRKPVLRFFTDKNKEADYVFQQIQRLGLSQRVLILARYKRDLKIYEDRIRQVMHGNASLHTAHAQKGLEADYVFYVGFQAEIKNDADLANTNFVGMSRARKKLYITTSYPKFEPSEFFDTEYLNVIDSQTVVEPERKVPAIKSNKILTTTKASKSCIDSISFTIDQSDVPFFRYVKQNAPMKKRFHNIEKLEMENGMEYSVEFNHKHKRYTFNFWNLCSIEKKWFW